MQNTLKKKPTLIYHLQNVKKSPCSNFEFFAATELGFFNEFNQCFILGKS